MSKLKKLFNRSKAESVQLPTQSNQPEPRSAEEINKQYTEVCTKLGHNKVNQSLLERENIDLMRYIESFSNEMKARQTLDAKQAQQPAQSDTLAPETTGVDASV